MPNLALCEYALPNGRTCRQPRLRDESHCRFHIRQKRDFDHDQRMYDLNDELEALDTPQLLQTLRNKLDNIRIYLRCYPEALLALTVAVDRLSGRPAPEPRLSELSPALSMTQAQPQQNQSQADMSQIPENFLKELAAFMTYRQRGA